jgi:hypothetical protein
MKMITNETMQTNKVERKLFITIVIKTYILPL